MVGCFIVGCNTGHAGKTNYHNFKLPRGASRETRQLWLTNIPKRKDREFDFKTCYVCHLHFVDAFIIKTLQVTMGATVIKELERKRWTLTKQAYPTIFANKKVPLYFNKGSRIRKSPTKYKRESCQSHPDIEMTEEPAIQMDTPPLLESSLPQNWIKRETAGVNVFIKLVATENCPLPTFHAERQVSIDPSGLIQVQIRGKSISEAQLGVLNFLKPNINTLINIVDAIKICEGVKQFWMFKEFPPAYRCGRSWISDLCEHLTSNDISTCKFCLELKTKFQVAASRKLRKTKKESTAKVVSDLRKKHVSVMKRWSRLKYRNNQLRAEKRRLTQKFAHARITSINDAIERSEISSQLKLAMKTAASLQKCSSKTGHRYPGDWILQSLLLRITSPKAYNHLRIEGILPLPHPKHLTRMLSGMKCEFGFNDFVLKNIFDQFSGKNRQDKQAFLVFDEMKVKEAISFHRASMRFTGFIDYGEFTNQITQRSGTHREADHALVFMARTLNSKLTQPIGVFATRGAAPGQILSKIILSAIVKLETAGLEVVGVVSDGATNNKSAWKCLGISGETKDISYKIPNPVDESRSIFFICDVPHIFKCIRNHFHKQKCCSFAGKVINWKFYETLYNVDSQNHLRAAPKLTAHHINPGPFQKMSVARAVQVFSKSVADALKFYRENVGTNMLKDSETTEDFTRKLNLLFDALNARIPSEGLKPGCKRYRIIQEFSDSLIPSDTFASSLTLASIRVTLKFTLDLINYLCNEVGYDYVLTSKFYQDCLEKFFGMIRSFGYDDCHPTIASFGHLYRLLCIYNPAKRAIKGNVQLCEELEVTGTAYLDMIKDFKIAKNQEQKKFEDDLENRIIQRIVCESQTSIEEESLNQKSDGSQFILFHLCGFIAFKAKRFTDCEKCQVGLVDESYRPNTSAFTTTKNMGGLKYPSRWLHRFIEKNVEPLLFGINIDTMSSSDFIFNLFDDVDCLNCKDIGCSDEHSESLSVKIILYYITIRMYFYSKIHNREHLKSVAKSKQKIKEGKLQ